MKPRFFLVLSAGLAAFAAHAQTTLDQADTAAAPAAATWSETIRQVFFADEQMTLRPEADIHAKWAALSADDQRIVRQDCTATRSGAMGGATPEEPPADANAPDAPTPPLASDSTGKAGSAVAAGDISLSHLVQICALVDQL